MLKKALLVLCCTLIFSSSSFALSSSRKLFSDIKLIPFGKSQQEIKASKLDKNAKLNLIKEGPTAKRLKKHFASNIKSLSKESYYDEDFSISFSSDSIFSLSLSKLKDYDYQSYALNSLISTLRLSFIYNKLFEKEATLIFDDISKALVVILEIEKDMGNADIKNTFVNYKGKNRFVWNSTPLFYVEYTFYPYKNIFKQYKGYKGKLLVKDLKRKHILRNYIKRVENKLQRLNR